MLCGICNSQNADNEPACHSCGSPLVIPGAGSSTSALQPGTKLDRGNFTVGKVLGQGGFGITYLGGDTNLGRSVAIKEFFPQGCVRQGCTVQPTGAITVADFQRSRLRFLEEARTLAQFHHRGIVQVFSTFEENNTAYMVMEFVKGKPLSAHMEAIGPLSEREVVDYAIQAVEALTTVHQAQFLHRDIKPENLMLAEGGRVVLVDFGTARAFASSATKRMTAMLTPGYAPLEQYGEQAKFGVFTDVYALGATCYHLLTGQVPVQAADRAAGVELQPPNRLNRQISQVVSEAVMWAMEMKADQRPQTAQEFVDALSGRVPSTQPASTESEQNSPLRSNPYEGRIKALIAEQQGTRPLPPASAFEPQIREIERLLTESSQFLVPDLSKCPGCGQPTLIQITGVPNGLCPLCQSGKLRRRKLHETKCPVCRDGQIRRSQLENQLMFCPICQTRPLMPQKRKRFGLSIDLWWTCNSCGAEFDVLVGGRARLVKLDSDPMGLGRQYLGWTLPIETWQRAAPKSDICWTCNKCHAEWYELEGARLTLVHHTIDPYLVAAKSQGKTFFRAIWTKIANGLSLSSGNVVCPECRADFDFDSTDKTLNALSFNESRFPWAVAYKGQRVPMSIWQLAGSGKKSLQPGLLCTNCCTEFDDATPKLRLIRAVPEPLSRMLGESRTLSDWHRCAVGVLTSDEEACKRRELCQLLMQQEEEKELFGQAEEERRGRLHSDLITLIKESVLGGFVPLEARGEHLPLNGEERLCWASPATRLKQRINQWLPYWDVESEGRLVITNQRLVFTTPDVRRWQRSLLKLHTARVECIYDSGGSIIDILALGFVDLQKPVAFVISEMQVPGSMYGCSYSVRVTLANLVTMLQSHFPTT